MAVLFDTVQIGPVRNGKQMIILPSSSKGAYIQCETTPEKVDEYMSSRKNIEKKAGVKEILTMAIGTVAGGAIGAISKSLEGSMPERGALGALAGLVVGFIGALGFGMAAQNKIQKLNENLIAENANKQ